MEKGREKKEKEKKRKVETRTRNVAYTVKNTAVQTTIPGYFKGVVTAIELSSDTSPSQRQNSTESDVVASTNSDA